MGCSSCQQNNHIVPTTTVDSICECACGCAEPVCATPQPCTEITDAKCTVYTGEDILSGYDVVVTKNASISTALNQITNYFSNVLAGPKIPADILCGTTVVIPKDTLPVDAFPLLVTYVCSQLTIINATLVSLQNQINLKVSSVTGLNTDNTDPINPIVKISVDGTTVTGLGTPASPLVALISNLVSVSYSQLSTLISTNSLVPDKHYLINDFQTVYDQPDHIDEYTEKTSVATLTGPVEPLIVTALTNNKISNVALSTVFPNDHILYDHSFVVTEVMNVPAKGRISQRTDTYNNTVGYDSRNVLFKRYWDPGWAEYCVYYDNGQASINVPTFVKTSANVKFLYEQNIIGVYASIFLLPNTVFLDDAFEVTAGNGFCNNTFMTLSSSTFGQDCFSNMILGAQNYNNTVNNNFTRNKCGNFRSNHINGEVVDNNLGSDFENNTVNDIQDCVFTDMVRYNLITTGLDNCTFDRFIYNNITIGFLRNNTGTIFEGNEIQGDFSNNTLDLFKYNTTQIDFENNTIGANFNYNNISEKFIDNTVGIDFKNNKTGFHFYTNIIGNNVTDNTFGEEFTDNTIGNNFISNTIGNNCSNNIILTDFQFNKLGHNVSYNNFDYQVQYNEFGNEFLNNSIPHDSTLNLVGDYCMSNNFLGTFDKNIINSTCQNNNIASLFEQNIIATGFNLNTLNDSLRNQIAAGFVNNTIASNFTDNIIQGDAVGNNIGSSFKENVVGTNFVNNTIGDDCARNTLDVNFRNNTIGDKFDNNKTSSSFYYNIIGNGFNENTLGVGFRDNTIGINFSQNNIGVNFYTNIVGDDVNNLFIQNDYVGVTIASNTNTETDIEGLSTGFVKNTNGVLQSIAFGTSAEYVRGDGVLATFPTIPPVPPIINNVTFLQLQTLISTAGLVQGAGYLITDFQTVYDQPDFSAPGVAKTTVATLTGPIEPLIVIATSTTDISNQAISTVYPDDRILYDHTFVTTEVMSVAAKGRITERTDTANNTVSYDIRNVLFKRYDDGGGYFTVYWDNGGASLSTIPTFASNTLCFNNYFVNNYDVLNPPITAMPFLLNNSVFLDTDTYEIKAGHNFYNNTIESYARNLTFGSNCYNNFIQHGSSSTVGNSFINNTTNHLDYTIIKNGCTNNTFNWMDFCYIDDFFQNNTINGHIKLSKIGVNFRDNVSTGSFENMEIEWDCFNNSFAGASTCILGNTFRDNVIGGGFTSNKIGNRFLDNVVGIDFKGNTIAAGCNDNIIGNSFESNTIAGGFYNNTIGNEFQYNNIEEGCDTNTIGNSFKSNNVGGTADYFGIGYMVGFSYNTIGSNVLSNTFGLSFMNNTLGSNYDSNFFGNYCVSNQINDNFYSNTTGHLFLNNIISFTNIANFEGNTFGDSCSYNILKDFQYNTIGHSFQYNTIDENFGYSNILDFFNHNTIGIGFGNNNISSGFQQNGIGLNFKQNNIGDDFDTNTIGDNFQSNIINNGFTTNIINDGFANNTTGNAFNNNTIDVNCLSNTFGNFNTYNNIAPNFLGNITSDIFQDNTIGLNFKNNSVGESFTTNTIGTFFRNNTIGDSFQSNTIGTLAEYNNIANEFNNNIISYSFQSNTIESVCFQNNFGGGFFSNTLKGNTHDNTFGTSYENNTFGFEFIQNTLGNSYLSNTIGDFFQNNTIGNNVWNNTLGHLFSNNNIGTDFVKNTFGVNCQSNTIGNNVNNLFIQNNYSSQNILTGTNTETDIEGLSTGFVKNTNGVLQSIAFGSSTDYVRGDGAIVPFPGGGGGGTTVINESKAIYIDATYGNDTTGAKYDLATPYLTWTAAIAAAVTGDLIIFNAGTYTESVMFPLNNINVYCKAGVIFTGTFRITGSITWKFLGNAVFPTSTALDIQNNAGTGTGKIYDIQFDFDRIEGLVYYGIICTDTTAALIKLVINCNSIVSSIPFRLNAGSNFDVSLNVQHKISGYGSDTIYFHNSTLTTSMTGSIIINCPIIENTSTANNRHVLQLCRTFSTEAFPLTCIINANVIRSTSPTFTDNGISNVAAVVVVENVDNLFINADLEGGAIPCIINYSAGATPVYGNVTFTGNMYSDREIVQHYQKFQNGNGWHNIIIKNGYILSKGIGSSNSMFHRANNWNSVHNGIPGSIQIVNCIVHNKNFNASATACIMKDDVNLTGTTGWVIKRNNFQMYNCLAFITGGIGYLISTIQTNKETMLHNVRSNVDKMATVTDLLTPTGLIVDANLIIPITKL